MYDNSPDWQVGFTLLTNCSSPKEDSLASFPLSHALGVDLCPHTTLLDCGMLKGSFQQVLLMSVHPSAWHMAGAQEMLA